MRILDGFETFGRFTVELFRDGWKVVVVTALVLTVATGVAFGVHGIEQHYADQATARVTEIQEQADATIARAALDADEEFALRVESCLAALDLADESIWQYFDGATIEREHPPTEAERAGHIELEREAYHNYTETRDECRKEMKEYTADER